VLVKILQNLEITLSSKVIMSSVSIEVLKQIYRLDQVCVLAMNFIAVRAVWTPDFKNDNHDLRDDCRDWVLKNC
jgi:hypothetical protein